MLKLIIFNIILIAIITVILIVCKRFVKSDRAKNLILLLVSLGTILCHYSSLVYHYFLDNSAMTYIKQNPNLLLPIYPCNVVMWSCLVLGLIKNKKSKFSQLLIDYVFWFGIISALVGMFANVDFIRNPNFANFDITKGIISHGILLLNVLLFSVLGYVKINLNKSIIHILISIVSMFIIGAYCNILFEVLISKDMAFIVNSMFILHSPFDGLSFLTYPNIALIALAAYFIIFHICELFAYKKGNRWYNRIIQCRKKK